MPPSPTAPAASAQALRLRRHEGAPAASSSCSPIVTAFAYLRVNRSKARANVAGQGQRGNDGDRTVQRLVSPCPLSFNDDAGIREHIALLMASTNVVYAGLWRCADGERRGQKIGEIARGVAVPQPSAIIPRQLQVERHPPTP